MDYISQTQKIVTEIVQIAEKEGKPVGFSIGNTAKMDSQSLYFTPIRNTSVMVLGGVVVYTDHQASAIASAIDGQVQYILVDAEKKIPPSKDGVLANVERTVREVIRESILWIYKGNDLSVDAVDAFLTQITKKEIRGIGGRRIAILGAGNLGAKLALKLVERGGHVVITRRNKEALIAITSALNYIKPIHTQESVEWNTNNEEAAKGADILIGTTPGIPVITAEMVHSLAGHPIIIDAGKGTFYSEGLRAAEERKINVYRLDVSAAFEGLVHKLWSLENTVEKKMGRRFFCGEILVSGGFMGRKNEIVVDNVRNPTMVYGIANGNGDFVRELSEQQLLRLNKFSNSALDKGGNHLV